ncbi:Conjugative accessory protein mbeC [Mycobacterium tuberculosis]|nr:Conjugative accessory protein mbeC [Mycobacterium tuberculosis]
MVEDGSSESASSMAKRRNRRPQSGSKRRRVLYILLSDDEHGALVRAAEREHLATAAWAALTLLAVASGTPRAEHNEMREVLQAVMQARGQAQRIGVNLNQAVAALNSGEVSSTIQWYARAAAQTIRKLDDLADELRRRLP